MRQPDKYMKVKIDELVPYANNARVHSKEQINKIRASIREFGFVNPVLIDADKGIIAGHGRIEAARLEGVTEVPCVMVEHLTEVQKRAYILADNRLAEVGASWDDELLKLELEALKELDFDTTLTGFDLMGDGEEENPYTMKSDIPQYEVTGEIPRMAELVDVDKSNDLIQEIYDSSLDAEEKQFLLQAATRHHVFNYKKIAEYYANVASPEMQRLMERSALVIIDLDNAIANGYVKLAGEIADMLDEDEDDEG